MQSIKVTIDEIVFPKLHHWTDCSNHSYKAVDNLMRNKLQFRSELADLNWNLFLNWPVKKINLNCDENFLYSELSGKSLVS